MSLLSSLIGKIPVVGGLINEIAKPVDAIARGAITEVPGGAMALKIGDAVGRAIPNPLGAAKHLLSEASSLGGGSLLDTALLGGEIADQAAQKKRQQDLQNQGLKYATDAYEAKAPLRSEGMSLLQRQNIPDLSSIFGNSPNPFAKAAPSYQLGTEVPLATTSASAPPPAGDLKTALTPHTPPAGVTPLGGAPAARSLKSELAGGV